MTRRRALALAATAGLAPALARPRPAVAITLDELRRLEREAVSASVAVEQTATVALEALANGGVLDDRTTATVRILLDHVKEHADGLAQAFHDALGEDAPLAPKRTAIPELAAVRSREDALRLAEHLLERAIATHLHTVTRTHKGELLKVIAGTVGSDAQGLVLLRQLLGRPPVPLAFERGRS
ncbi:MAG: hypothetical protein QOG86_1043 [Thermoleophilaceae bacterium]|jgi:hypothetical protein|nr:hypothetical protein [Thermoleophilaceae bacterium]MEA2350102.1 hypothetical protein [Thermoleophilaceae bacterium]MEA2351776.1 hypothetical protein [Thermoleophilaceae bacterium]